MALQPRLKRHINKPLIKLEILIHFQKFEFFIIDVYYIF